MPVWLQVLIAVMGGGGIVALLRYRSDRAASKASTDSVRARTSIDVFAELERIQAELRQCDHERASVVNLLADANKCIELLMKASPFVLTTERLLDFGAHGKWWDLCPVPVAITDLQDGGRLVWINKAFCDAMGRSMDECVRVGWRGLVHPDDLTPTKAVEATAWDGQVWGYVNRYLDANGSVVRLRWYSLPYMRGGTISWAFIIG